jgi:hypothetical protein
VTALARREQRAFYQRLVNANRPANDLAPDLPGNALALGNVTRRDLIVRPRAPGLVAVGNHRDRIPKLFQPRLYVSAE